MIAFFLLPVFAGTLGYACWWALRWLAACAPVFRKRWVKIAFVAVNYSLLACLYLGALLPHGRAEHIVKLIGNYWYGCGLYTGAVVVFATGIRWLVVRKTGESLRTRKVNVVCGGLVTLLMVGICVGGILNARIIRTTRYDITIPKDGGSISQLKLVLAADLHMGHNIRASQMEQMVEKINACDPDIVVIGGDIFDNEFDAVQEPERMAEILSGIRAKYGVYATYGNHDIEEPIIAGFTFPSDAPKESSPQMDALVEQAGFVLLRDEAVLIENSFYIYGRPDEERPGRGIDRRAEPEEFMPTMDGSKPILVVEHEPKLLDKLDAAGVDLHLAGHTHDGQLFPLNLVNRVLWQNSCGYLQMEHMQSIVTSGVGLYGPNMRVGTIPEICEITIHFGQ